MGKSKDISAEVIEQIAILIAENTFSLRQMAAKWANEQCKEYWKN